MSKVNTNMVTNLFLIIIFVIIIFQTLADTATDIGDAADNLSVDGNASDSVNDPNEVLPLTSFFKKKGVVLLALMAGIVIVIVKSVLSGKK